MNLRYRADFKAGKYYHVFNRSHHGDELFRSEEDSEVFLSKLTKYLRNYVCIYSCVLLPKHFHLLIRCREIHSVRNTLDRQRYMVKKKWTMSKTQEQFLSQSDEANFHQLIEVQFLKLFTSYSMIYNHRYQRSGKLFERPFKRRQVDSEDLFSAMIHYMYAQHPVGRSQLNGSHHQPVLLRSLPVLRTSYLQYRDLADHIGSRQMQLEFDREPA